MPSANVNYTNSNTTLGFSNTDLIKLLVPREYFSQGGIYTWGAFTDGVLGDASTTSRSSPGTLTLTGQTSWQSISMKGRSGGAIRSDATLWTWGRATYGVLGYSSTVSRSSPGTVAGGGTNWEEIHAATGHMIGIKNDGTLWSWGRNANGQLGDNSTTNRSSPGTLIAATANGDWHTASTGGDNSAGIKIDGTLWTWGDNVVGQLGSGSTTDRSSPATVAGGGTTWDKVSVSNVTGATAFAAAIKTDGTLWTWGSNATGQLGDGATTASRSSPNTVSGGGTNWFNVSCGYAHIVAVKLDGTLWTWGSNNNGALGIAGAGRSSPGTITSGGTTWKICTAGNATSAAIKSDGTLWTWGLNTNGNLGDGSTTSRSSPVTVSGSLLNWTAVSLTGASTSANMLGLNQVDLFHFPEINVYTTPGSFTETIPEGNHTALIEAWGAGGRGGDGYTTLRGGGGGSGGYCRTSANVLFQVGKTADVVVGLAADAGGGGAGEPGGNTSVSSLTYTLIQMTANGGFGGSYNAIGSPPPNNGAGGIGGPAAGGTDVNTTGSIGTSGSSGGAGGVAIAGRNAVGYGTGGQGSTGNSGTGGGAGANGAVIITYF